MADFDLGSSGNEARGGARGRFRDRVRLIRSAIYRVSGKFYEEDFDIKNIIASFLVFGIVASYSLLSVTKLLLFEGLVILLAVLSLGNFIIKKMVRLFKGAIEDEEIDEDGILISKYYRKSSGESLGESLKEESKNILMRVLVRLSFKRVVLTMLAKNDVSSLLRKFERVRSILRIAIVSFGVFLLGFLAMEVRFYCVMKDRHYVTKFYNNVNLKGEISHVVRRGKGSEVVLSHLAFFNHQELRNSTPKKIRFLYKGKREFRVGQVITAGGMLFPLPRKVYPNFYDIEARYHFKGIDGFASLRKVKIVKSDDGVLDGRGLKSGGGGEIILSAVYFVGDKVSEWKGSARRYFYGLIDSIKNPDSRSLALSVFLGNRKGMSTKLNNDLANSGISHLATISGLHISIITGFLFVMLARVLSLIPNFAVAFSARKFAAVLSIIFGFAYLVIIDFPVSALRSYIMSSLFLLALLMNRSTNGFRSVVVAGIVILCLFPEEVMFASFQFSFVAVSSLVLVFRMVNLESLKLFASISREKDVKLLTRGVIAVITFLTQIIISTITVSIALLPFTLYHFSRVATYSVISNTIAVPLFSFFVMPAGMLSIFSGSEMLMQFAGGVLGIIISFASSIASAPYAIWNFGEMSSVAFAFFLGASWFLILFRGYLKYLGFVCIFFGILVQVFTARPDAVMNRRFLALKSESVKGNNYILIDFYSLYRKNFKESCKASLKGWKGGSGEGGSGKTNFLCKKVRKNKFLINAWKLKLGIPKFLKGYNEDIKCIAGCCYNDDMTVLFGYFDEGIVGECGCSGKYLIDLRYTDNKLLDCLVTNDEWLKRKSDGVSVDGVSREELLATRKMCSNASSAFGKTCNFKKIITSNFFAEHGSVIFNFKSDHLKTTYD